MRICVTFEKELPDALSRIEVTLAYVPRIGEYVEINNKDVKLLSGFVQNVLYYLEHDEEQRITIRIK